MGLVLNSSAPAPFFSGETDHPYRPRPMETAQGGLDRGAAGWQPFDSVGTHGEQRIDFGEAFGRHVAGIGGVPENVAAPDGAGIRAGNSCGHVATLQDVVREGDVVAPKAPEFRRLI